MGKRPLATIKSKVVVFDSWALIAFFGNEDAAERVTEILGEAHERNIPALMTVVNAGEIWYNIAHKGTEEKADQSIRDIGNLGIQIINADWNLTRAAAGFKKRGRIAYADCFAAALAKRERASLVTGDREFEPLENEITVIWV